MIRFLNLVLRDAPLECPFVPESKHMPFGLLGSMITAGTQMSANYDTNKVNREIAELNYKSQQKTNEANQQIAKEANEWNYRMMNEQNAWNLDMWNRQNAYNSPEHMVQLYKKAGLNPALLNGQSPTPAGGLTSADAKEAQKAYQTAPQLNYSPLTTDFAALGDNFQSAVNSYFQNRLVDSQRKKTDLESSGQGIINEQRLRFMPYELNKLQNEAKKEGVLGDIARSELAYQNMSFQSRLGLLYGDLAIQQKSQKLMDEQLNSQILDNRMKSIMNEFQPKWNDMQLRQASLGLQQIRASIGLIAANTTLSYEQALHESEKKISTVIDNGMKAIDYDTKQQLKSVLIDSAKEDLYFKQDTRYLLPFEKSHQFTGKLGQYFPYGQGSYGASRLYDRNIRRDGFR